MPIIVRGMRGLGDNLFQRPFIRALARRAEVFVETPYPEFYDDLDRVRFLRPDTLLRTQAANIARQPAARWAAPPRGAYEIRNGYGSATFARGWPIWRAMRAALGITPAADDWDLPGLPAIPLGAPYVVIRPATVRREWFAPARNPRPRYLWTAAIEAHNRGFKVISIADLADPEEESALPPLPPASLRYHKGELRPLELLALVRGAAAVIGGVGWIVPAAILAGVPLLCICGGLGGHNAPDLVTPPVEAGRWSRARFVLPTRYCRCADMLHRCDKTIDNFRLTMEGFFDGLDVPALADGRAENAAPPAGRKGRSPDPAGPGMAAGTRDGLPPDRGRAVEGL